MTSFQSESHQDVDYENISAIPPHRPPLPSCYIFENLKLDYTSRNAGEDNLSTGKSESSFLVTEKNSETSSDLNPQYWLESGDDCYLKLSHNNMIHYNDFFSKIEDFVNQMNSFTEELTKISNEMIENKIISEKKDSDSKICDASEQMHGFKTPRQISKNNQPPLTVKSRNIPKMPQDDVHSHNEVDSKSQTRFAVIKNNKITSEKTEKKISFSSYKSSSSNASSKDLLKPYANKSSQCDLIMHYADRYASSESLSDLEINRHSFYNKNSLFPNRHKCHKYVERQNNKIVPAKFECCSCSRRKYHTKYNSNRRYPSYENYLQHPNPASWLQHPFLHSSDGYQFFSNTQITRNDTNVSQPLPNAYFGFAQGAKQTLGKSLWNEYQ